MITKVIANLAINNIELNNIEKKPEKLDRDSISININNNEIQKNEKTKKEMKPLAKYFKALWVIDEKNNVYIRIEDEEGNLIKQIPPEELMNLKERIKEYIKNSLKRE